MLIDKLMRALCVVAAASLAWTACAAEREMPAIAAPGNAATATLTKAQAIVVANRFFAQEIAMEGAVAEPTERGDDWVFPVKFGYANVVARDPILVNRHTGKASWAGLAEHNARLGRNKPAK